MIFLCSRYNFHKAHCAEALNVAGESVDKALEILFYKYFKVDPQEKPTDIPTKSELEEMRSDEKAVLESIYDTNFKAKDAHILSVSLNLDYITKLYKEKEVQKPKKKENISYNNNIKTKKKEICKLFLRGPCRFGAKCKFLHETNEPSNIETKTVSDDSDKVTYELEVRFPEDTVYPYQPPLLLFKTVTRTNLIPELACLRITARLLEEAKILAQDGIPSVYSLVELLNNEEDIINYIQFDTSTFPQPTDALLPQLIEDSSLSKKKPSHYKKGQLKDHRSNVNFENVLKENKEIVDSWLATKDNNKYSKMMSIRRKLPAWQKRKEILDTIKKSQVC